MGRAGAKRGLQQFTQTQTLGGRQHRRAGPRNLALTLGAAREAEGQLGLEVDEQRLQRWTDWSWNLWSAAAGTPPTLGSSSAKWVSNVTESHGPRED